MARAHPHGAVRLAELIEGQRVAMLTTVEDDGSIRCRPMITSPGSFDGELWFFTSDDSAKVHEVEHDQHVNVSFSEPGRERYVSISGTASLVHDPDRARRLWSPQIASWFPRGADDPSLLLLRV